MLVRLAVTLTLEGPVLTRATQAGAPGLDSPVARDADGRPILPYSLVQGRLREAWREIGCDLGLDAGRIEDLLGRETGAGDWAPQAGRLLFRDFRAAKLGTLGRETSVRLDPDRQAADEGALHHLEIPFPAGERVDFAGEVRFLVRSDSEAGKIAGEIEQGLRWVPSFGSDRTVGFGRLLEVQVRVAEPMPRPVPPPDEPSERLPLQLTFRDPLCIARRPEGGNLFEASEVVPGGAIKGTLARMLRELAGRARNTEIDAMLPEPWTALGAAFDRIRFTHGFPALPEAGRPAAVPESFVEGGGTLYDVALCPGPCLIEGRAPAFSIDWKSDHAARREVGWPEQVARELRVRTAIDPTTRRGADEKLFAYEMIRPEGLVWHAEVDLSAIDAVDRAAVARSLRLLFGLGLQGVGKTGAEAEVRIGACPSGIQDLAPLTDEGGRSVWVVSLQTPALLADPRILPEGSGDRDLFAAYTAAWNDLSDGRLPLLRFFSRERLVGGYLTERFRRVRPESAEREYRPYLLSESGSVFVFAAEDADGAALLARWRTGGLPLSGWAEARYGTTWRTCPFTRFDGYGEIAVNHPIHQRLRPVGVEEIAWQHPSAS